MRLTPLTILTLFCVQFLSAQVSYTANDDVPSYSGEFRFGSNMGYYPLWDDEQLADIAAGSIALDLTGAGVKTLRPALPEHFLEQYGYTYRVPTFQHYESLGIGDNTVFVGYPSEEHRDSTAYCTEGIISDVFKNMYSPIWDNGENGTPVNDTNYYALYMYRLVDIYKDYIQFYEIWNEPDFDYSSHAWLPPGTPGNWWDNDPDPCDYALHAPVESYVRMLRISYDVIKSADPDAYVAIGGLGYPSFLDAVLRNTDNPNGGDETPDYPLKGGAYFDCLSYHSYPHIDGSLREWNNDTQMFDYFRHSDAAVDGYLALRDEFETVLGNYDYDGNVYPKKVVINTESNIPRKKFGNYIGSDLAQLNYLIKALVTSMKENILQFYVYNLAEFGTYEGANNEFELMGLYEELYSNGPYDQVKLSSGIAYKTTSDLLSGYVYDPAQTALMALPSDVDGGAFLDGNGEHTYVLWGKTSVDESEDATTVYSFPANMEITNVEIRYWNYSENEQVRTDGGEEIKITSTPSFLRDVSVPLPVDLLYFRGKAEGSNARLEWLSVSEENNDYYEIEYSRDGADFESVAKVAGAGTTSTALQYHFIHRDAKSGDNYYRLKQVDFDENFEYTPIVNVPILSQNLFVVSPTLTTSLVKIAFDEVCKKVILLEVFDSFGRSRMRKQMEPGSYEMQIDLADFPAGIYFLKIRIPGEDIFTVRVLKEGL